jgi:hypothetical protein
MDRAAFRPNRLFGDVEAIPYARPKPIPPHPKPKLTEAQQIRLARDLAIYLAIHGGMSYRTAGRAFGLTHVGIFKAYQRMCIRKSRV